MLPTHQPKHWLSLIRRCCLTCSWQFYSVVMFVQHSIHPCSSCTRSLVWDSMSIVCSAYAVESVCGFHPRSQHVTSNPVHMYMKRESICDHLLETHLSIVASVRKHSVGAAEVEVMPQHKWQCIANTLPCRSHPSTAQALPHATGMAGALV
jgi:hypothetical protein